ncbi:SCAN box domain-containing protein [Trichonephila inaurata madagascariensis]|uniref:SCAN box domain-containing protein n=1 Tax=Trichonephila inaurata madagascariensis TaxID=2747483 RepID=A0A8X6XMH5_9ARAC|nr:SCAN box domain-containing protein [Trichonephila inaurata madagascariensis]
MAYLAKGNKPDLLSVCEEMGGEIDQSSKVVDIKKLILNSQFYVEEEVKIILDRFISDRKEQERREKLQTKKETSKDFQVQISAKREPAHEKNHEKDFEKRRQLRCYECGSYSHLRPQCDKLKKTPESISHVVTDKSFDELMARYTSLGKVNGVEMKILRDTGATLDLICNKYVKPHMYTNEKVWLRTPLEESLICLPLAEVELDCEMGHVITKAAVLRDSL